MKRFYLYLCFVFISTYSFGQDLINLDRAKSAVKNYYESGQYANDVKKILDSAKAEIDKLNLTGQSVVIFDVDDTILSGYEFTASLGFGFTFETWKQHLLEGNQSSVPHMKEFYDYIIQKGIKVIFLTGRGNEFYESTYKNLMNNGFTQFDTLICRSNEEKKLPASEYKNRKRNELTKNGYSIVACFGDQESDLRGENTGLKFKLPNYLYEIE